MGLVRINGFPMDLSISEEHSFPGEVTERPVEEGSDFGDHIRDLPEEITLECIVSDLPTGDIANDPTRQPAGAETALPSADALAKLRELKAAKQRLTIETSIGVFESMAFLDLNVPRDKDKNNALFFTAKFKRVRVVTNKRTRVRVKTSMAGAGGKGKAKSTALVDMVVKDVILWAHGNPPGTRWVIGNPVERVKVVYSKSAGLTRDELVAHGKADPRSPLITYFYEEGPLRGTAIIGIPRLNLLADLDRDRKAKIDDQIHVLVQDPNSAKRGTKNLPAGVDMSHFEKAVPDPPKKAKEPTFGGVF